MADRFETTLVRCTVFAALMVSSVAAVGQKPPAATDPEHVSEVRSGTVPDINEIIVPGERVYDEEALESAVSDISMRGRIHYRPIPRYNSPICIHVAGLAEATSNKIKSRIEEHAAALRIPLASQGCKVNAQVVLVNNPEAFIDGYRKQQPWVFGFEADQTIRRAINRKDPAIIWFNTIAMPTEAQAAGSVNAPTSRIDMPMVEPFGVPTTVFAGGGENFLTPLRPRVTRSRENGTIVFDTNRLEGFTARQVADYASMRLFGNTQPTVAFSDSTAMSILSMFETGPDDAAPGLTLLDRAYLQGIYRMKPYDHPARLERSTQIAYRDMLQAACTTGSHCETKIEPASTGK